MSTVEHDVVVIGAGPGGYVCAIRCAQLGYNVACIEKEPQLGGTCLRVGCIPSKALLESSHQLHKTQHELSAHGIDVANVSFSLDKMMERKVGVVKANTDGIDFLFKKNKVTRYLGTGCIKAAGSVEVQSADGTTTLSCKHIIIATGSVPSAIPGVELDGNRVGTSTEALKYPEVPKKLVVIGAGVIGMELGSVWKRLGSDVQVLEYANTVFPGMDGDLSKEAVKTFKKQGFDMKFGVRVTGAKATANGAIVTYEGGDPIECDYVLVATGRKPNTEGLGLENVGIVTERGRVPINDHFQTPVPGIYAIGDVVRGAMLAHKAEDEGVAVAEFIHSGYCHINYDAIPGIVYTHPEVASVGKTEEQLKEAGIPYKKGKFLYRANGRARALNETDGFVKVLAHGETDRLLGAHIIGAAAGDLIAECAVAMEFGASCEDLAMSCHAHPTLSECVKEACLDALGRVIHS